MNTQNKFLLLVGLYGVGVLVLIVSWGLLFWWMMAWTDAYLIPWDTFGPAMKPSPANWQRGLNDFFEHTPAFYLASGIVLASNAILFVYKVMRTTTMSLQKIPWAFALANLVFIFVSFMMARFTDWVVYTIPNVPAVMLDLGYPRNIPTIVVTAILLVILFKYQHSYGREYAK